MDYRTASPGPSPDHGRRAIRTRLSQRRHGTQETIMINKISLTLAAALVAGFAATASADPMIDDVNSGLPTMIYNAPLAQLQAEGLPVDARGQAYVTQHPQIPLLRGTHVKTGGTVSPSVYDHPTEMN
jgi:hypothetical protein